MDAWKVSSPFASVFIEDQLRGKNTHPYTPAINRYPFVIPKDIFERILNKEEGLTQSEAANNVANHCVQIETALA